MKKFTAVALLLAILCILPGCAKGASKDSTEADTTIPVTSPEGFEDVTAPPEDGTTKEDADTSASDSTEADTAGIDSRINSADEAIAAARAYKGESDPDTGYKYAYSYDGSMIENDIPYFRIRVSWYIEEEERYSRCGYLLVSPDGDIIEYDW